MSMLLLIITLIFSFEQSGVAVESTDSGSPSISYLNQQPGSSVGSASYLQELGQ